jgi:hypothetical protein
MAILLVASSLMIPMAFAQGGRGGGGSDCCMGPTIAGLPLEEVDAGEQSDLIYMREEEKLARDVYRAMDSLWGLRAFRNISYAEQRHMDALLGLLERHGIADPVGDRPDGEFDNTELQDLFNQLVAQGSDSLNAALIVGATIEDLDIHDLDQALTRTDNQDIQIVYQNLRKGSRNHLRAFNSLLEANGVTYTPQFISQIEFDEIVNSPMERGPVDASGEPTETGNCGRARFGRGGEGRGSRW